MQVEPNKWGIVYNPRAGIQRLSRRRWKEIREYIVSRRIPFEYNIPQDYMTSEEIARSYAERGFKTIVVIGGDSVLNDVVNGIMNSSVVDKSSVAIGIIPNGFGNDFANYWGLTSDYKDAIDTIIEGRKRMIDVGYASHYVAGVHRKRFFVNAMNLGLGAQITKIIDAAKRFFVVKWLSYVAAFFAILFVKKTHKAHLIINGEHIRGRVMTVCIGSAHGYGQTPSAVPYNGWLDVSVIYRPKSMQLLKGLWMMVHGRLQNHKKVHIYRTRNIKVLRVKNAITDVDGRLFKHSFPLEVGVMHEVLTMIIPNR